MGSTVSTPIVDSSAPENSNDINVVIKWASEQVDNQAKTLCESLGHPIPIVIDWDHLKTAIPASPEETHNIIVWLAKHALNIVSDHEGGLGELLKDPFAKQILVDSLHKLEIRFEPDQSTLEKVFGGIFIDSEKQFRVEIVPDTVDFNPSAPQGTLVVTFGPQARRQAVKTLAKTVSNIFSIVPRKIVQDAQPSLRKAENQLESVFGAKIQLEVDLSETFEYFPHGKEIPNKEQISADQKEKIAHWITTFALDNFMSSNHGILKAIEHDPENSKKIIRNKVHKVVFVYDVLEENFLKEALNIISLAYEYVKDRRFRIVYLDGVMKLIYAHDYSIADANNLHLHIQSILDFKTQVLVMQCETNAQKASETLSALAGKPIVVHIDTEFKDDDIDQKRAILHFLGNEGLELLLSEEKGLKRVFQIPEGLNVFKAKVNKINLSFRLFKNFLEDSSQLFNLKPYSRDSVFLVELEEDGSLNISFGSKLTMNLTKLLSAHLAHVLGVDRQELVDKVSQSSLKLQQYLGGVSMKIEVAFDEIDKDPSTLLNKDKIANSLVEVGVESLVEGLNQLSLEQKAVLCERVDIIRLTYDLAASGTSIKLAKRTDANVLTIKYGAAKGFYHELKTGASHVSEFLAVKV